VCAAKSGTEGSNPSLSASKKQQLDDHLQPETEPGSMFRV
jgi:hypothetical protein